MKKRISKEELVKRFPSLKIEGDHVVVPGKPGPGPLESYPIFPHCEMCGARDTTSRLEPAFDPSGQPKTLCRDCRIGSAELLADLREALLEALKEMMRQFEPADPGNDDGLNDCDAIILARAAIAQAIAPARRPVLQLTHKTKDAEMREFVARVARMKTQDEFADDPDPEDWAPTLNNLIASARKISRAAIATARRPVPRLNKRKR